MSELRMETWEMPAAVLGAENPLPVLQKGGDLHDNVQVEVDEDVPEENRVYPGYGKVRGCLPHRLQSEYGSDRAPRHFKAAVLENDILRAIFLLELGGRLWSLVHKPSGRELLHVNPVFQPRNLAIRNAWFSGGVEWNIGMIGHTAYTCSSLFAARVDGRGGPVLRLYEWDRIREIPYQIDFWLPDGSEYLLVRPRIVNPHDETVPMYWWSNIAVDEFPGMRVVVPAEESFRFDYTRQLQIRPVPVTDGIDISYPTNIGRAADFFFRIPKERRRWIASLDPEGRGLVQTSTSRLKGRKLFVWGMGPGGKLWSDYLSVPGKRYVEVQAGLCRTQMECMPMPARSEWAWVEAYGLMEAAPEKVHGESWQDACEEVTARLGEGVSEAELERLLGETVSLANRAPVEILHRGSGWGALEKLRRETAGEKPFCGERLLFGDESLGEDQQPWLALLKRGALPERDPADEPGAYMAQQEWRDLLEESVRSGRGDHWLSRLHLGIMFYQSGDTDRARGEWEASMGHAESAWAARNLAVLCQQEDRPDDAADLYLKAAGLALDLFPLQVECGRALVAAERGSEWLRFHEGLPSKIREQGRIQTIRAQAIFQAGDLDEVEDLLRHITVTDIREGETTLSDLWFRIQERRLAQAEGVAIDDALRERVRKECPPPRHLDFRMTT
ncbi:DUF5107 domain-containing protein [bacterium]|nr:DUF5107 domain-containing protein [bacterium]